MNAGLVTAGSGQSWENELVAELDRPGSPLTVIRRCVDIADVLAEAATGQAAVVVVSAELRRLDTEAVERLRGAGVAVVAVHPAGESRTPVRLGRIGITHLVPDDVGAAAMVAVAREALDQLPAAGSARSLTVSDPRSALAGASALDPVDDPPLKGIQPGDEGGHRGLVVAVWGPTGAPGRSTIAAGLAVAAAATGSPTLLIDADVYGGVLASAFGLLDESAGLAGACRAAANGRLDGAELARLSWAVQPDLWLLTGITRADRWPELRPSAIPVVLQAARSLAAVTVVDCGFALEADEEITFDTMAPRRNGATLATLTAADLVVAVGSADPPGTERLVRGLTELGEMIPQVRPVVVVNRVRRTAASAAEAQAALRRFTGYDVAVALPEDRAATDRAWERGVPVAQAAPSSPLTAGIAELTLSLGIATRAGAGGTAGRTVTARADRAG